MRLLRSLALAAVALSLLHAPLTAQEETTLFGQSSKALLDRMLDEESLSGRTDYLLMNARTLESVAASWESSTQPIAVGSLLKPFVALAYAQEHDETFPRVVCHGRADGCWRPAGHGRIGLRAAVAASCNAYFLALASSTSPEAMQRTATAFGLPRPPQGAGPPDLIGLTAAWRISPVALAAAYSRLGISANNPPAQELLAGMRLAASSGTAARIGSHRGGVLAKTGTAPCRDHACAANGDGLVVAMLPADQPRLLLLVRQRGTTGANAAALAGRMLDRLESFGGPR